jgi:hypothetical protein
MPGGPALSAAGTVTPGRAGRAGRPAAMGAGAAPARLLAWLQGIRSGRDARHHSDALERLLDGMATRVAQAELALLRQQEECRRQAARAEAAEAALVRLQDMLDRLRDDGRRTP